MRNRLNLQAIINKQPIFFFAHRRMCACACAHGLFFPRSSLLLSSFTLVCAVLEFFFEKLEPAHAIFTERIHQSETTLPALCVCNMVAHTPRRHLTHITTRILTPRAHCMMCIQYASNTLCDISNANRHIILWGLAYS